MPRKHHFQHRKADKKRERDKSCQAKHINSTEVQLPGKLWGCLKTQTKTVYCKWDSGDEAAVEPAKVLHNVTVKKDGTWTVYVYGKEVDRMNCDVLKHLPVCISPIEVTEMLSVLDQKTLCAGHPDDDFVAMIKSKKGKILSVCGKITSFLDENPVEFNGKHYSETIRTTNCNIFASGRCKACIKYRGNLRSIHTQWKKSINCRCSL